MVESNNIVKDNTKNSFRIQFFCDIHLGGRAKYGYKYQEK